MGLEISESEQWPGVDRKGLSRCGERLLETVISKDVFASLYLTGDEEIHRMNRRFRHVDRPTDVLSFPAGEEGTEDGELGEVVISVETAARQAGELGESLMERMVELLAHGILHLSGLDHEGRERASWDREEGKTASLVEDLKAEVRGGAARARNP